MRRARAASPRLSARQWPIEPRRRNAGARSASPRRRRPARPPPASARCRSAAARCWASPSSRSSRSSRWPAAADKGDAKVDTTKLAASAKAAGCTFSQFKSEGRNHTASKVTYKTNPPTSGNHNPTPAQDGLYRAGNSPPKENFVHSLEHGRIEFQYKPGTSAADVAKLRRLAEEPFDGTAGYHVLLFENDTNMPAQFAATAWTKSITCPTLTSGGPGRDARVPHRLHGQGPRVHPVTARA